MNKHEEKKYDALCDALEERYIEQDGQGFLLVRRESLDEYAGLEYQFRNCDGWGSDERRWMPESELGTELAVHNDNAYGSPRGTLLEAFANYEDDGHDAWLCWLDDDGNAQVEGIDLD